MSQVDGQRILEEDVSRARVCVFDRYESGVLNRRGLSLFRLLPRMVPLV
jgi:hypothetical protein